MPQLSLLLAQFGPHSTRYTGPIGEIIKWHRLDFHLFADNSQSYVSFGIKDTNDETFALPRIQACVGELKAWITYNRLQLNDSKTEVSVITIPSSASKHNLTDVVIGDSIVNVTTVARKLGVMFDRNEIPSFPTVPDRLLPST